MPRRRRAGGRAWSGETKVTPADVPRTFAAESARAVQSSPSTIEKSVRIGEGLCGGALELLEGTPVADRKADLLKIARLGHDGQLAVAGVLRDGRATTYLQARKFLKAAAIRAEPRPLPPGPFRVIAADPPWRYEKRDDDGDKRENTT